MFYTYLWLREDGTPYYVGKGKERRAFKRGGHICLPPTDASHIILQEFESEADAFSAEIFLIDYYGRINVGTGCLRNLAGGGAGPSGRHHSLETRTRMRAAHLGYPPPSFKGLRHTEVSKEKVAAAKRGKKRDSEWVNRMLLTRAKKKAATIVGIVRVRRSQAKTFRRKAREAYPLEMQVYLSGHVVSPQLVVVDKFWYTTDYFRQTESEVQWTEAEYDRVLKAAEVSGKRIVGDAHSHPDWDAVLSPTDYQSHIKEGHRVAGICSIQNGRTRLRFWIAESALPLHIEYV